MEALNKISILGLSAVLMFALAVTANASAMIDEQAKRVVITEK